MRHKVLLVLTALLISMVLRSQISVSQIPKNVVKSKPGLKWVVLDDRYRIQVPANFTLGRVSGKISSVPAFYFNAKPPAPTSVQVEILPRVGTYMTDPKTGRPQIYIQGTSLTRSFEISGGMIVYYGWSVTDNAYECSMNSPCPLPVPPSRRYGTLYVFAAFDEGHSTIVKFTGYRLGPTENVTALKGDGKLLRDVIIPSLSPIQ